MKYKKYPKYKDSGIEWLGEIPEHWEYKRLKNVIRASITDGPHETPQFINKGVPFLSVDGIQKGELTFTKCRYISESVHKIYKRKAFVEKDDILLGKAASIGKVARVKVNFEFSIWSPLALIKPKYDEVIASYLEYLLKSDLTQYQIQQLSTSNTQQNISMSDIPKFRFSLPERKEQEQITIFLDNATAKIDTLIKKQTKLIELLKEKRQALISHAVTKGINPNVAMKDTDITWLNKIPKHWIEKQFRYATKIYRGKFGHRPRNDPSLYDGDYPFVQTGDVARANKYITKYKQTLNNRGIKVSEKFPKGTLIMAIAANIGDVAILNFEAYAPDSIVGFLPNRDIDLMYLRYSFIGTINILKSTAIQSTQANLNIDRIANVNFLFPPLKEQKEIADYLDTKTSKIDKLIEKANDSIKLLKEKRVALISAAVTGKIDVRDIS